MYCFVCPICIVGHISKNTQNFSDPILRSLLNTCHLRELFWMVKAAEHHGKVSQPELKQILPSFHVRQALCVILCSQITMLLIRSNKRIPTSITENRI